ncbi:hypothetical protein HDV04_002087 [Boothiomyces sp. JEL0838]|nr:hypothetical protein HDV04_002087 [Boothiomyces sp. JEL0838]
MKFADTLVTTCYFNAEDRPSDLDTTDLVYITLGTNETNNSKEIIWTVTSETSLHSLSNLEIKKKIVVGQLNVDNIDQVSVWASFDSFESQFRVPCFYICENNVSTVNFELGLDFDYHQLSLKIIKGHSEEELNIHYELIRSPAQSLHERRKIRKESMKIKTDHYIPLSLVPSFLEKDDVDIWVPTAISTNNLFHFNDDDFHVPSPSITSGLLSVSPVLSFPSIFA